MLMNLLFGLSTMMACLLLQVGVGDRGDPVLPAA